MSDKQVSIPWDEFERLSAIPVAIATHEAAGLAAAGRPDEAARMIQDAVSLQSQRLQQARQGQSPATPPVPVQPAPPPPPEPRTLGERMMMNAQQQHQARVARELAGAAARDMAQPFGLKRR
jgi:hypothetical protein